MITTNAVAVWRERRSKGGVLIDLGSDALVERPLAPPPIALTSGPPGASYSGTSECG